LFILVHLGVYDEHLGASDNVNFWIRLSTEIVTWHVYMQLKAMRKCSVTRGALLLSSREDFCNKPIKSSINGAA